MSAIAARLPASRFPAWSGDAAMASAVVVSGGIEFLTLPGRWTLPVLVPVIGGLAIAVLLRRLQPHSAATLMGAIFASGPALGYRLDDSTGTLVGGLSVVWGLAEALPLRTGICGAVILTVTVTATFPDPAAQLLWNGFLVTSVFGISGLLTSRKRAIAGLAATTRELEASRDAVVRARIELERTRISGELNDVVAHAVSLMVVQATAAESILDADPLRARDALGAVQDTGRKALNDLRSVLAALRDDR